MRQPHSSLRLGAASLAFSLILAAAPGYAGVNGDHAGMPSVPGEAPMIVAQVGPPPVESQGKPINPMDILGGSKTDLYQAHSREQLHAICNQKWNECAAVCNQKPIPGSRNACLKKCDKEQEKCLDTYP